MISSENQFETRVPNQQPRDLLQRLLELLTGFLPFIFLAILVFLSRYNVEAAAVVLLIYTLAWLVRLLGYARRLAMSFYYLKLSLLLDWHAKLCDIKQPRVTSVTPHGFWQQRAERWYNKFLASGVAVDERLDPAHIYHAVIVAVYNESESVIASTLKAIQTSTYDHEKILLIIAYEERGGKAIEESVHTLIKQYGSMFALATAIKHPEGIPGEAKAKAGNITFAAKFVSEYCLQHAIRPEDVLVTTLDADNRPHPQYLAALAWMYAMAGKRTQRSYQPVPLFTNNIWDVPALVRVIATDSSFWFMMQALQPERLRLFSAHAQSLQTLQDTHYWNVAVVVEDGHQYWRTYFTYNGDHHALPVWLPIYQDAVQSHGYWQTLRAQFQQLKRWAWGTADTPWLIRQAFRDQSIGWPNKLLHIWRQLDDYITWSTAPIVLTIGGWLPLLISPHAQQSILALRLPYIISGLQVFALVALIVPVAASLFSLPPRPARYGRLKNIAMVLQWVLEPIALIFFVSASSLSAHLRLIFNKPLETFHATVKVRTPD